MRIKGMMFMIFHNNMMCWVLLELTQGKNEKNVLTFTLDTSYMYFCNADAFPSIGC